MALSITGASGASVTSTRRTVAAFELQDADEAADRHRFFDERGDEVRRRHGEVDTPVLVEQPFVLRVVHARAMTRGTPNSCLASNEITRLSSSSPVAATTTSQRLEAGRAQRVHLARIGDDELDAGLDLDALGDVFGSARSAARRGPCRRGRWR